MRGISAQIASKNAPPRPLSRAELQRCLRGLRSRRSKKTWLISNVPFDLSNFELVFWSSIFTVAL
jgi:hypothetical protein